MKEIFEKFYFKILNDEHKKYELREEYINKKILEEQEQREMEEQKKQQKNEKILLILKIIFYIIAFIVCAPIAFCLLLVFAAMKGEK